MNKSITKIILNVILKIKPVLIKILPIKVLRTIKREIVNISAKKAFLRKSESYVRGKYPLGINLIGFIKGEIGLGQSCRLIADAINNSNIEFTIYNYEQISSMRFEDNTWEKKITNKAIYSINLIHLNPPDLVLSHMTLSKEIWNYKYNIAFWLWELEDFPEEWTKCFELVDEVWTPSKFVSKSIMKKTTLPVRTMVYPISAPVDENIGREHFKLPKDRFLFLCMYDSNSNMGRKNPIGSIEAFKKAFTYDNDKVGLVIKVNNTQKDDIDKIKNLTGEYKNIYILSNIMTKIEVNSLIKNIDVLISLHRAEGFGLPLAEAMLLGTPTIATNWSANTEFMNNDVACMVDYKLSYLEKDYGIFKKGNRWAEPDINHAAIYMRKLFDDKEFYKDMSVKAQSYIRRNLNLEKASKAIESRIREIY